MVDLPTPPGPAMTISRPRAVSGEFVEEGGTLPFTQATEAPVVGDLMLLHESLGLHLPGPGHRGEQCRHLDPPDELVLGGTLQQFGESKGAGLQQLLRLCSDTARLGRSSQGGGTLL